MCGVALTGVAGATAPDAARARLASEDAAAFEECLPGTAARVTDAEGGTRPPEGGELSPSQAADYHRQLREALVPLRGQELQPPHTIPVVVHVISSEDGSGDISDDRVREQIDVLNTAYSGGRADVSAASGTTDGTGGPGNADGTGQENGSDAGSGGPDTSQPGAALDAARAAVEAADEAVDTGFRFELTEVTRTVNDDWFANFDDNRDTIRARLRQGDAATLNIYTADLGPGLLGYSTFPQDYEQDPEQDGVVVAHDTLPGGDRERFNLGHTTTHEVGHWLGLFHTFQNGCDEPGDYVDDTPYEREAASGCPGGRDTCPDRPGEDPVTNFMNYSDDACMTHFTDGQGQRMVEHWAAFREGSAQQLARAG